MLRIRTVSGREVKPGDLYEIMPNRLYQLVGSVITPELTLILNHPLKYVLLPPVNGEVAEVTIWREEPDTIDY